MTVTYSDCHPTLYVVHGRAKTVLRGPNSTEPNLLHHGETTFMVGGQSEYAIIMIEKKDVCPRSDKKVRSECWRSAGFLPASTYDDVSPSPYVVFSAPPTGTVQ